MLEGWGNDEDGRFYWVVADSSLCGASMDARGYKECHWYPDNGQYQRYFVVPNKWRYLKRESVTYPSVHTLEVTERSGDIITFQWEAPVGRATSDKVRLMTMAQ